MSLKTYRNIFAQCALALCVALYAFNSSDAGVVSHGMVMGPGVAYIDITESSSDPVPLYGAPIITPVDQLSFFEPSSPNPSLGFSAEAAGGSGDLTDGFLNLTIMAKPAGGAISLLEFSEGGDYTMAALGNALAQVSATLNVFQLNILEVDNAPIAPITLSGLDTTTINLPGDPAQGQWELSVAFNINQALTDNGIDFDLGATKLTARVNNTLTALTQPGSVAGIFKKDFDITPDTPLDPFVPEPTTLVMASFGLGAALLRRKA